LQLPHAFWGQAELPAAQMVLPWEQQQEQILLPFLLDLLSEQSPGVTLRLE